MTQELLDSDITRLSFVIVGLFVITSMYMGKAAYNKQHDQDYQTGLWVGNYVYELLPILGLIGTVIGFIYMFGGSFSTMDPSDQDSVKDALIAMAAGISTALYTTLLGMITSEVLKLQVINLEGRYDATEKTDT